MCHVDTVEPFKPCVSVACKSCGYFLLDQAQIQLTLCFKSRDAACFTYNHMPHLMLTSTWFGVSLFICSIWLQCNRWAVRYACIPMQMDKYFLQSVGFHLPSEDMNHFLLWKSCSWHGGCGACQYRPNRWSCPGKSWATELPCGCSESV